MHPNALLLHQLFESVNRREDRAVADCYHRDATFHDIAFDLRGKKEIHDMWRMICAGDLRVTFEVVHADDQGGRARVVDEYTFSDTKRRVRNVIDSRFRFADDRIIEHNDDCDPRKWAAMAIGGISGFVAGRVPFLRRLKASRKLRKFVEGQAAVV
jgi:SnoaL-like domain